MNVKPFRVAFDKPIAMLVDAPHEIASHADIHCTTGSACKDVKIELPHARSLPKRDGRDKPGHDGEREARSAYRATDSGSSARRVAAPTAHYPPRSPAAAPRHRAARHCGSGSRARPAR